MTSYKFDKLFNSKVRNKETEISQFHMDLAASIQKVTEEIVIKLAKTIKKETGLSKLCLAGGVALNCVANGKLLREKVFDEIWIQPASGDSGSSIGAGLYAFYNYFNGKRKIDKNDSMKGSFLGPVYSNKEIIEYLSSINASFKTFSDKELYEKVACFIDEGNVVGWFNGPMEFGPRALGARSIIGDPRNKNMQSRMNLKIKFRESFRPFAPSVLEDEVSSQFDLENHSPYMLLVAPLKKEYCYFNQEQESRLKGLDKISLARSSLPAVTHVDYTSRVQTVSHHTNPRYHNLIKAFKIKTGCPVLINTSFNVRGEPIVCTPQEALKCFMRTEMDILVLENQILLKSKQKSIKKDDTWEQEFEPD